MLVEAGLHKHRYPECWRCHTPLIFRIADDWFISRPRSAAADARRERDGVVDAGVHGQAHGRLAAQHGRLEHLAAPLLRAAAAVLSVRVRAPERDRFARRAGGACARRARAARGAAAAVDRPRADRVRGVRRAGDARGGGRRRLARRGDRSVLDARLAQRGVRSAGLCDRRGARADDRRSAGSRVLGEVVPGGLGLGDARADPFVVLLAAVHVGRARGARAVPAMCSATRRCSTRPVARCTGRGGTRSPRTTRSS